MAPSLRQVFIRQRQSGWLFFSEPDIPGCSIFYEVLQNGAFCPWSDFAISPTVVDDSLVFDRFLLSFLIFVEVNGAIFW